MMMKLNILHCAVHMHLSKCHPNLPSIPNASQKETMKRKAVSKCPKVLLLTDEAVLCRPRSIYRDRRSDLSVTHNN